MEKEIKCDHKWSYQDELCGGGLRFVCSECGYCKDIKQRGNIEAAELNEDNILEINGQRFLVMGETSNKEKFKEAMEEGRI